MKAMSRQHRAPALVFEMHILELDAALGSAAAVWRRGRVLPFRLEVYQAEVAFGAGHGGERLVILVADDLDRVEEEVGQEKEHHQVAHFHVQPPVPAQRAVAAEQRHRAEEQLALHLQQGDEHRRGPRHADVVFAVQVHQLAEEPGVDLLPHEGLRDPDAADRFGQRGRQPAPGLLQLAQPVAHLAPIVSG